MRSAKRGRRTLRGVEFVRLGAGRYVTVDGRFLVERDESTGSSAWWLDDRTGAGPELVGSLLAAAREIAARRSGSRSTPPVGADTPPVPAGGVVPDPEPFSPGEGPAGGAASAGGFSLGDVARMLHPSCHGPSAADVRGVTSRVVDDTIFLLTANNAETFGLYQERLREVAADPGRAYSALSSLSTCAMRMILAPPAPGTPPDEVIQGWRSFMVDMAERIAARFEEQGR